MMDKSEIEQLFQQHYGRMLRQARCLLYDEEESRDVVSEVFASLLKPSTLLPSNIVGYLAASVRHRCLDLLYHKDVRARFEKAYVQTLDEQMSPEEDEERLDDLMAYMQRELKPQTLQAFKLRHLEGLKYQEIADRMGISRVMVYKHLAQAAEQLKDYVSKQR